MKILTYQGSIGKEWTEKEIFKVLFSLVKVRKFGNVP